jgi:hypothetical protein
MKSAETDSEQLEPIDFEQVRLGPGPTPRSRLLTVSGSKRSQSAKGSPVKLNRAPFLDRKGVLRVQVLGNRTHSGAQILVPFEVSVTFNSIGTKYVEIVGATRTVEICA